MNRSGVTYIFFPSIEVLVYIDRLKQRQLFFLGFNIQRKFKTSACGETVGISYGGSLCMVYSRDSSRVNSIIPIGHIERILCAFNRCRHSGSIKIYIVHRSFRIDIGSVQTFRDRRPCYGSFSESNFFRCGRHIVTCINGSLCNWTLNAGGITDFEAQTMLPFRKVKWDGFCLSRRHDSLRQD